MKETTIQNSICEYLQYRKVFFWRNNNIPVFDKKRNIYRTLPKYAMKGTPDIIVVKDGFFIGLEVKMPKQYQSREQKEFQKNLKEAGGEYYVVRSINDLQEIGL